MHTLPINLHDLTHARSVESVRREFKKSWSDETLGQTIRTIAAFANDFFNLNGGYIILGVEEKEGLPLLPPSGLENFNLDEIQKQIRGHCKKIAPEYQPVLAPELYPDKHILVIWAPAGDVRPYQAPEQASKKQSERHYYVRQGAETTQAKGDIFTQLLAMTAKVPFDDRRNTANTIDVLSPSLVRNFLSDIKSDLVAPHVNIPDQDIYRYLRLSVKINGHEAPKNIALLQKVTKRRLTQDALELFRRAIQLSGDNPVRMAWCYYDLARALNWLGASEAEVTAAYQKAVELLPNEPLFSKWYTERYS